jgi:hypothetical protein
VNRKVILSIFLLFGLLFQAVPVFAEDLEGEERKSKQYDESRYELMTYADDDWWDLAGKTGSGVASSIKNFLWMTNIVIANIVLMVVYQLFSLDIIELTKGAVQEITSSTAASLVYNFGLFALAVASIGIVVRSYVQQNWRAFFKLLSLILISLTLLFSIQTKKFNYIDLAHSISTTLENAVMKANPSLTDSDSFDFVSFNDNSAHAISTSVENKVFDALIYKPYLILQYGTTDEAKIDAEKSGRIEEYLEADPTTQDGIEKREEISQKEYEEYNNKYIFAGNAFKQAGYIMIMILSTIIQGVVFFFIALVRIMLQFAFIVMMLLAPIMLFVSIFPSFEAVVAKYTKGTFLLILFKGITMFFVLVATSFITLGYDMTDMSDDLYYRIFIQILFSVAVIFMYMKRQFVFNMLEGATPSLSDMGANRTGRTALSTAKNGIKNVSKSSRKAASALNKGRKTKGKKVASTGVNKAGAGLAVAGESARNARSKIGDRVQKAREYIGKVQNGENPNYENPYSSAENEVAASDDKAVGQHSGQVNVGGENVSVLSSKKAGTNSSLRDPRASKVRSLKKSNHESIKQGNKEDLGGPSEISNNVATSSKVKKPTDNKKSPVQNVNESSQAVNSSGNSARNPYKYQKTSKDIQQESSPSQKEERRIGGHSGGLLNKKSLFKSSKDE